MFARVLWGFAVVEPMVAIPRHKRPWSTSEVQALEKGVAKHGVGSWATILADPSLIFDSRTTVDLKDKFSKCIADFSVKVS